MVNVREIAINLHNGRPHFPDSLASSVVIEIGSGQQNMRESDVCHINPWCIRVSQIIHVFPFTPIAADLGGDYHEDQRGQVVGQ